jgi:WXXGXW repeat (2 copies)
MRLRKAIIGIGLGLFSSTMLRAQAPPVPVPPTPPPPTRVVEADPTGVEVLTRGPIHEAFAEPLGVNPRPNPIIHEKPPANIEEIPPEQKPDGDDIEWIGGYFAWDETGDDFIWISGLWRAAPPGRDWMPGHWVVTGDGDGWQWISGYWADENLKEVEYLPPPPASVDTGPATAAPDADSLYLPGAWVYQDRRYLWRPGFWFRAVPNWFYTPSGYTYTPAGYIFTNGYWDYPLQQRGMFFAPVRFAPNLYARAGWNYQPRYSIGVGGLLSSLFVRPDYNRYYFGNYYGNAYQTQGFVPWFDYRVNRNTPDPLFRFAQWNSRADVQWEGNMRSLHRNRLAGTAPLPPATLVLQREMIRDMTANKRVMIGGNAVVVADPQAAIRQLPVGVPIRDIDPKVTKLVPVAKSTPGNDRNPVRRNEEVAKERQKRENGIVPKGGKAAIPALPTDPPVRVKIEQPKTALPPRTVPNAPPTLPVVPKNIIQPIPKQEPVKPIHVTPRPKPKPQEKGKGKEGGLLLRSPEAEHGFAGSQS